MPDTIPIPGTVQLVDVDHNLGLQHGSGQQDIILIPQPTADPNDPLNWTPTRRYLNTVCQMVWTFFCGAQISGLSPAYLVMQEDTGISVADLSTGNGLMYLFMGWGTLITQTLAISYGRRPCSIVGMLGIALMTIWSAHVSSVGEWYANRILIGLFASPQEAMIELCITDVHFTHVRGFHMGLYNWTLWCGAFLSPIAGGFVAESLGWRWIQYILAIIGLVVTVLTFLLFEETMFFRKYTNAEAVIETTGTNDTEKPSPMPKGVEAGVVDPQSVSDHGSGEVYQVKTYLNRLKVWGLRHPEQPITLLKSVLLPFQMLRYPTVIFSGLLVGTVLAWYNVLGGTMAEVLGDAPYNFSTDMIGLTYFACVIGASVGCYVSGWVSDLLALRLARRRQGIKEPEDRLWMAVIPLLGHPLGCILYGVGAVHGVHWIGVVIGMAFICLTLPVGSGLAITYIIDCYKELAGESVVVIILIRNTIGFAFAYAVNPMISTMGLQNAFILIAMLGVFFWACTLLWIVVGRKMRRLTASSYWKLVETHGLVAH